MSRNLKNLSPWARNLVQKVRAEIKDSSSTGVFDYSFRSTSTSFYLDIDYIRKIEWREFQEQSLNKYGRLMKYSGYSGESRSSKYTGPMTYEEIEKLEDITK